jgi:hypothetical protein
MTEKQALGLHKLEKKHGTKANITEEVLIVSFSPDVSFAVDKDGRICTVRLEKR